MALSIKTPLVLATNNKHKVKEIKAILRRAGIRQSVKTLSDFPQFPPVIENKKTIEGNAAKKAKEVAKRTGCLALADDTGLFVAALNGAPGVYSARFAGPGCTFEDNNRKLLTLLKGKPMAKRGAVFRCIAALATPQGKVFMAEGRIQGKITAELKGRKGFGYDPVFHVPRYKKAFAEMSPALKNKISHRARAFRQVPQLIKKIRPRQESNLRPTA